MLLLLVTISPSREPAVATDTNEAIAEAIQFLRRKEEIVAKVQARAVASETSATNHGVFSGSWRSAATSRSLSFLVRPEMRVNATFPVDWRQVFKSVAIFMSSAIIGGVLIPIGIATILGHAPKRVAPFASMVAYVLVLAPLLSTLFAFLISKWFRLAAITVVDGVI